jgi:inward rectifier potassium channel
MALFKRRQPSPDDIEVVGARRLPLGRDLYHLLLRAPWWADLVALSALFLLANMLFATLLLFVGGVEGAHGFDDLFFFSVQTMGTIGYGAMYPKSTGAELVVTAAALTQIFLLAVTTGLVFAKFSVPRARVQFAHHPVIGPFDGVPTLQFRLGNERDSRMLEALIRVVMMRTEKSKEGITFYRMHDIVLERDRSPALARSWTVMHKLVGPSPLVDATPETLARDEVEFILTLVGTDETSAQPMHAQRRYFARDVRWGARHADLLSERSDGGLRLDMTRFHHVVSTAPTDEFPYGDDASA